jgi:hypothetical protein
VILCRRQDTDETRGKEMPNWVYNGLTVTGDSADINRFVEQVGQPYETRHYNWETKQNEPRMNENVGFSFWNIVAPDESIRDEYWATADHTAGPNNWYPWNNENWGTKWDAAEVHIERHADDHLQVSFQTAWSPPYPVVEQASVQFPMLTFTLEWEEEQGFGAEVEVKEGEFTELRSWDIPNSHADYAERDNEDGCPCSYDEDTTYWFEDCPGKVVSVEKAVQMFEEESARL